MIQSFSSPTCTSPGQLLQCVLFTSTPPHVDRHRFTSAGILQCSPFPLALQNNRYERQPNYRIQSAFPALQSKMQILTQDPWECRPQFSRHLPTDCQKDEKLFRATLLKAASHHIPTGRRKLYTQQVQSEILAIMEERDDIHKQDPPRHGCRQ